jgi:hypothetical protein
MAHIHALRRFSQNITRFYIEGDENSVDFHEENPLFDAAKIISRPDGRRPNGCGKKFTKGTSRRKPNKLKH